MNHHLIEPVNTRAFKESVALNKDGWKGVHMSKRADILWPCIDSIQGARLLFNLYQHDVQSTDKTTSFVRKNLCYRSSLRLECFSPLGNSHPAFALTSELFTAAGSDLHVRCALAPLGSWSPLDAGVLPRDAYVMGIGVYQGHSVLDTKIFFKAQMILKCSQGLRTLIASCDHL